MSNPETPEAPQSDKPKTTDEHAHPKKEHVDHTKPSMHHEHAVIHPAEGGVTHIDPGAIIL